MEVTAKNLPAAEHSLLRQKGMQDDLYHVHSCVPYNDGTNVFTAFQLPDSCLEMVVNAAEAPIRSNASPRLNPS